MPLTKTDHNTDRQIDQHRQVRNEFQLVEIHPVGDIAGEPQQCISALQGSAHGQNPAVLWTNLLQKKQKRNREQQKSQIGQQIADGLVRNEELRQ